LICIDLQPCRPSLSGQVILYLHDSPRRFVIANSFQEWLSTLHAHVAVEKKYEFDVSRQQWIGECEAFQKSSLEGPDYFIELKIDAMREFDDNSIQTLLKTDGMSQ